MLGFHSVAIGRFNRVAALRGFSKEKIYGCLTRTNKSGHNNKVTQY